MLQIITIPIHYDVILIVTHSCSLITGCHNEWVAILHLTHPSKSFEGGKPLRFQDQTEVPLHIPPFSGLKEKEGKKEKKGFYVTNDYFLSAYIQT